MRARRRLGVGGELAPPGPNPAAQWLFLQAVERVAPAAMAALTELAPSLPDGYPSSAAKYDAEAPLRAWCEQWGFTGEPAGGARDWLLAVGRRTARYLREKAPGDPPTYVYARVWRGPARPTPIGPWCPDQETEAGYRARVDAYVRAASEAAQASGWTPRQEQRNAEHYDWLACYQVAGWTLARIAERYQDADRGLDVSAVSLAVKRAATLAGVRLRPARRGRRRILR